MTPLTFVVGAGGLLGSSVVEEVRHRGELWQPGVPVPWSDPTAATTVLRATVDDFLRAAAGRPWQVLWCAGAGVTASTETGLAAELTYLTTVLDALGPADPASGAVFLASSAGGVYAGSPGTSFTESSPAVPLAPYGRARLAAEAELAAFHERTGVPTLVGRISNLYGPKQNLAKAQGLISQLCRAQLLGRPLSIYVPLDTLRDYLYVGDGAALVVDAMDRLRSEPAAARTKVLASQQAWTIGSVIAEVGRVFKRRPRVVFGTSPSAGFQARAVRLRSEVWPDLDARTVTPLAVGIRRTADTLRQSIAAGILT